MTRAIALYIAAAVIFFPVDMLWLGVVARDFYKSQMGDLLSPQPIWPVALIFYAIYLVGLVALVMIPAAREGSILTALGYGALFGLVAYGTYDLTNLSVLRGYPATIALTDLAWGTVLTAVTAAAGTWLAGRVVDLR